MHASPTEWLKDIRAKYKLRNTYKETMAKLSPLDRLAVFITDRVGTMGFVFWLFISNMIQILLMPLIMVGQNIQGRQSEARAEHDLEVNIKAEQEIEIILQHLARQNEMLIAMLTKQGVQIEEIKNLQS